MHHSEDTPPRHRSPGVATATPPSSKRETPSQGGQQQQGTAAGNAALRRVLSDFEEAVMPGMARMFQPHANDPLTAQEPASPPDQQRALLSALATWANARVHSLNSQALGVRENALELPTNRSASRQQEAPALFSLTPNALSTRRGSGDTEGGAPVFGAEGNRDLMQSILSDTDSLAAGSPAFRSRRESLAAYGLADGSLRASFDGAAAAGPWDGAISPATTHRVPWYGGGSPEDGMNADSQEAAVPEAAPGLERPFLGGRRSSDAMERLPPPGPPSDRLARESTLDGSPRNNGNAGMASGSFSPPELNATHTTMEYTAPPLADGEGAAADDGPPVGRLRRNQSLVRAQRARPLPGVVPGDLGDWAAGSNDLTPEPDESGPAATQAATPSGQTGAGATLPPRRRSIALSGTAGVSPPDGSTGQGAATTATPTSQPASPHGLRLPPRRSQVRSDFNWPPPNESMDVRPPRALEQVTVESRAADDPMPGRQNTLESEVSLVSRVQSTLASAASPMHHQDPMAAPLSMQRSGAAVRPSLETMPSNDEPSLEALVQAPRNASLNPDRRDSDDSGRAPSALSLGSGPGVFSTTQGDVLSDSFQSTSLAARRPSASMTVDDRRSFADSAQYESGAITRSLGEQPLTSCQGRAGLTPHGTVFNLVGTPSPPLADDLLGEDILMRDLRDRASPAMPANEAIPCTMRPAPAAAFPGPPFPPSTRFAPLPVPESSAHVADSDSIFSPGAPMTYYAGLSPIFTERYGNIECRSVNVDAADAEATLRFRATNKSTGRAVTVFRRRVRTSGSNASRETSALAEAYRFIAVAALSARRQADGGGDSLESNGLFEFQDAFVDADAAGHATLLYTVFDEHPRHWIPKPMAKAGNGAEAARCLVPASNPSDMSAADQPVLLRVEEFADFVLGSSDVEGGAPPLPAPVLATVLQWLLISICNALFALHRSRLRHGGVLTDVYITASSAGAMESVVDSLRDGDAEAILQLTLKLGPPALNCTSLVPAAAKSTTDVKDAATVVLRALARGLGSAEDAPYESQVVTVGAALGSARAGLLLLLCSIITKPESHTAVSIVASADGLSHEEVEDDGLLSSEPHVHATLIDQMRVASGSCPMLGIDETGTLRYASTSCETLLGTGLIAMDRPPLHIEAILRTGINHRRPDYVDALLRAFGLHASLEALSGMPGARSVALPPREPRGHWSEPCGQTVVANLMQACGARKRVELEVCILPDVVSRMTQRDLNVNLRVIFMVRDCSVEYGVSGLDAVLKRSSAIATYVPQAWCVLTEDGTHVASASAAASRLFAHSAANASLHGVHVSRLLGQFDERAQGNASSLLRSSANTTSQVSFLCATANARLVFPALVTRIGRTMYFTPSSCETGDVFASLSAPAAAGSAMWSWLRATEIGMSLRHGLDDIVPSVLIGTSCIAVVNAFGIVVNILQRGGSPGNPLRQQQPPSALPRRGSAVDLAPPGLNISSGMLLWDVLDPTTTATVQSVMVAAAESGEVARDTSVSKIGEAFSTRGGFFVSGASGVTRTPPADAHSRTIQTAQSSTSTAPVMALPSMARRGTLQPDDEPSPGPPPMPADEHADGDHRAPDLDPVESPSPLGHSVDSLDAAGDAAATARPSEVPSAGRRSHAMTGVMADLGIFIEPRISATDHYYAVCICARSQGVRVLQALAASS